MDREKEMYGFQEENWDATSMRVEDCQKLDVHFRNCGEVASYL
jgi:hypothetical protein